MSNQVSLQEANKQPYFDLLTTIIGDLPQEYILQLQKDGLMDSPNVRLFEAAVNKLFIEEHRPSCTLGWSTLVPVHEMFILHGLLHRNYKVESMNVLPTRAIEGGITQKFDIGWSKSFIGVQRMLQIIRGFKWLQPNSKHICYTVGVDVAQSKSFVSIYFISKPVEDPIETKIDSKECSSK